MNQRKEIPADFLNSLKTFRELFRYNEQKGKEVEKITSKERLLTVMNQYQNLVFSICLKLTGDYFAAEDLTQDTFLSVYRHFGDFDGKNEKAWICRIATNKCYDYNQAAERRAIATAQDEMPEVSTPYIQEPLQQVLNLEILDKVSQAINNLPPPYKEVAREQYLEGHTAKEIALHLGKNIKTVQTQQLRARELLQKELRKEILVE